MNFKIEIFPNGEATLKDQRSLERMHSSIGPWAEANTIYVNQTQLLLNSKHPSEPIVFFDIGLGIATNTLATLDHFSKQIPKRSLHFYSFETDLGGISHALENPETFPFIRPHIPKLQSLLKEGHYIEQSSTGTYLKWEIRKGDFQENLSNLSHPDIIYYDMYSPKAAPELWGYDCFKRLSKILHPKRDTLLITYSSSTSARAALLLAGFHVGRGRSTPAKKETTVAATNRELLEHPLDIKWLEHWKRSSKAIPYDYPEKDINHVGETITNLLRSESHSFL